MLPPPERSLFVSFTFDSFLLNQFITAFRSTSSISLHFYSPRNIDTIRKTQVPKPNTMVVDTLIYHPTITHYIRFVSTTVGRDKALRTLQYLARFLSWYLLRKGYTASAVAPWEAIKKNFGLTRKVMRIGKNVEHLKAAYQVSQWSRCQNDMYFLSFFAQEMGLNLNL
jgi:hypothetical protein